MDNLYGIVFGMLNVVFLYFLRNNLLDLFSRLIQNLNRPLDYVASFLMGSVSSIVRLTYRQLVLNFVIVVIAVILVFSEYNTLNEVVKGFTAVELEGINLGFAKVEWSVFAAISYIAIATILGFIAFELIGFRELLQGILFNDPPINNSPKLKKVPRSIIAIFLLFVLGCMAFLQGEMALYRLEELAPDERTQAIENYAVFVKGFYFSLGFLTPIIAAMTLVSFDIFLSIIASFVTMIIVIVQKIIAAIYYGVEVFIMLVSAPIDKLLELFGIYQVERVNAFNEGVAKLAKKIAPLGNKNEIFLENKAELYANYSRDITPKQRIVIVCDNPDFKMTYPSVELPFSNDVKFEDVKGLMVNKYPIIKGKEVFFSFIDLTGAIVSLKLDDYISDYIRQANFVFVDIA